MMAPLEYAALAAAAWALGFAPVAELLVAVPAARATGLDPASVVVWTVAGNFAPVPLVHLAYERLVRVERVRRWFDRLASARVAERMARHGTWVVLFATPWVGVWAVAVAAKALRMRRRALFAATFASLVGHAVVLVVLIEAGVRAVNG